MTTAVMLDVAIERYWPSISAVMVATGASYEQVQDHIARRMAPKRAPKPSRYTFADHACQDHAPGSRTCFIEHKCGCQECTAASSLLRAADKRIYDRRAKT